MDIEQKRKNEEKIMALMVQIYCRGKHGKKHAGKLCEECQELLAYATLRTQKCPFMDTKTFCSACTVHCYSKEMRQRVKGVMKYAGPRIVFYHPLVACKHGFVSVREKIRKGKGK